MCMVLNARRGANATLCRIAAKVVSFPVSDLRNIGPTSANGEPHRRPQNTSVADAG